MRYLNPGCVSKSFTIAGLVQSQFSGQKQIFRLEKGAKIEALANYRTRHSGEFVEGNHHLMIELARVFAECHRHQACLGLLTPNSIYVVNGEELLIPDLQLEVGNQPPTWVNEMDRGGAVEYSHLWPRLDGDLAPWSTCSEYADYYFAHSQSEREFLDIRFTCLLLGWLVGDNSKIYTFPEPGHEDDSGYGEDSRFVKSILQWHYHHHEDPMMHALAEDLADSEAVWQPGVVRSEGIAWGFITALVSTIAILGVLLVPFFQTSDPAEADETAPVYPFSLCPNCSDQSLLRNYLTEQEERDQEFQSGYSGMAEDLNSLIAQDLDIGRNETRLAKTFDEWYFDRTAEQGVSRLDESLLDQQTRNLSDQVKGLVDAGRDVDTEREKKESVEREAECLSSERKRLVRDIGLHYRVVYFYFEKERLRNPDFHGTVALDRIQKFADLILLEACKSPRLQEEILNTNWYRSFKEEVKENYELDNAQELLSQ